MPAPALAAIPILVSFAEAAGIVVAGVATAAGIDTLSKKVEEYVEENPEQSQKILAMIMPAQGIANILKNESDDGEEVSETEVEIAVEEKPKLTGKEKGMRMRQAALQKKGNYSSPDAEGNYESKRGRMIRTAEELGLADPDLKDNYKKSNFDYKKYFRKADGGIMGSDKTYHQVRDQFMPMDSESMEYANGGGVGSMMQPKRKSFRKGGDTMGGKNDKSKTSKGPDRSAVGPGSTYANNVANQNDGGGGINNTINNINKPTVFDKVKNTVNKVVDSPLTAFIDPRSKLALAMGGYKYLRDGVTPFQQQSIDEELENIKTKGGIVPYADGGRVNYNQGSNWWDTLDPQGMNVYNSMKRGGHDDATIQSQLAMLGYYDPNTAPPDSTPDDPNIINQNINQGGDGGGGITASGPGLGYTSQFDPKTQNKSYLEDIGEGTIDDDDLSFGLSLKEGIFGLQKMLGNIPTPLNLALKAADKFKNYRADKKAEAAQVAQAEKAAAEKQAALNAINASMANDQRINNQQDWTGGSDNYSGGMDSNTGNYNDPYDSGYAD